VVDPTTLKPISSIQIKYDGVDTSGGGSISAQSGGGGEQNAPEPLSWLVWSALAGAGLWRLRFKSH